VTIAVMRPSARRLVLFRVIDRITAIFGGRAPLHWLSIVDRESGFLCSNTVSFCEIDGRTYITDLHSKAPGWGQNARLAGQGTLTTGGTGTGVTLTEVTDPALKRQVLALRSGGTLPASYPHSRLRTRPSLSSRQAPSRGPSTVHLEPELDRVATPLLRRWSLSIKPDHEPDIATAVQTGQRLHHRPDRVPVAAYRDRIAAGERLGPVERVAD
jgi:hypothetical protein